MMVERDLFLHEKNKKTASSSLFEEGNESGLELSLQKVEQPNKRVMGRNPSKTGNHHQDPG